MTEPVRITPSSTSNIIQTKQTESKVDEGGQSFTSVLDQARLKFSNHAQKRLDVRSIDLDNGSLNRLSTAVDKAEARGSKESLILLDDRAFIVNIRDRMVVTTMDVNKQKDSVFTQIDSVVIAEESKEA
jgi:flagellar operon protein